MVTHAHARRIVFFGSYVFSRIDSFMDGVWLVYSVVSSVVYNTTRNVVSSLLNARLRFTILYVCMIK
jgi:hypothetical protein